ncbi:MAG: PrgI family protein [Candidatus Liptonbacteria bacterium]|nr:PrgI family protein [Candidatus Liptonbacteria bacterium]
MQFQVPQFIEAEDKIVGPFTMRQFIYVATGGAFSFLLYFTVQPWLWALLSVFILGAAVALALVKVGGRPLSHAALSAIRFYWQPQTYVWRPETAPAQKPEEAKNGGVSLESVVSGLALRNAWAKLQTGTKISGEQFIEKPQRQRFQIFQKMTGERQAARRVDYR